MARFLVGAPCSSRAFPQIADYFVERLDDEESDARVVSEIPTTHSPRRSSRTSMTLVCFRKVGLVRASGWLNCILLNEEVTEPSEVASRPQVGVESERFALCRSRRVAVAAQAVQNGLEDQ
jgi:hypothetical protein